MEKECKVHGLTDHFKRKDTKSSYRCRKCASESIQNRRNDYAKKSIEYKGSKCEICNYDRCFKALEFHHINPELKLFGISEKGYTKNWNTLQNELDKCILVCANCHREIHEGLIDLKEQMGQ